MIVLIVAIEQKLTLHTFWDTIGNSSDFLFENRRNGNEALRQGLQRQAAKPAKQAAGRRGGRPCGATPRPCCFLPASQLQRKARLAPPKKTVKKPCLPRFCTSAMPASRSLCTPSNKGKTAVQRSW